MMLNIFLDLEGTVIDEFKEFPTFLPSKVEDIRRFIEPFTIIGPPKFHIFSFAIQDRTDAEIFNTFSRSLVEQLGLIGLPGELKIVTVNEMLACSKRTSRCSVLDIHDFIMLIGKERAFHDWCNLNHSGEFNFLIDDVVPNRTTHDNAKGTVTQTLNVADLFKTFRIPRKVPA